MKFFRTSILARAFVAVFLVLLCAGHLTTVRAISQEAYFVEELLEPRTGAQPQSPPAAAPVQAASAPAARSDNYVENSGFKGRVFQVKYRDATSLVRALSGLTSGFKGATMQPNDEFRTITVRDFPENIATIEEALKRLDVQQAPQPDIEFTLHVLIASNGQQPQAEVPAELNDVVRQLQSTLRYKSYGLMTSAIHRAKEGLFPVTNTGVAESKLFAIPQPEGSPTFYNYQLERITLDQSSGSPTINVGKISFEIRIPLALVNSIQYEKVGFQSPLNLHQGEKVVVGSTTMGDKGLVLVISARVLK